MRVQRTRTQPLRAPLTTTLGESKKYAVQFQVMFVPIINLIIVTIPMRFQPNLKMGTK